MSEKDSVNNFEFPNSRILNRYFYFFQGLILIGSKRVVHYIINFEFPNSRILNTLTFFFGLGERM